MIEHPIVHAIVSSLAFAFLLLAIWTGISGDLKDAMLFCLTSDFILRGYGDWCKSAAVNRAERQPAAIGKANVQ